MRVLQINNYHYPRGGSDRYFLDLTTMLRERGHDVRTFSTERTENIHRDYFAVSPVQGCDTERAGSVSNVTKFVYSPAARRQMEGLLAEFRPDIVHLHIYYGQLTASILKPLREAGIPVVHTQHEYKLVCPTHGLYAHGKYCDACGGSQFWHALVKRCNRNSMARSGLSMAEAYVSRLLGDRRLVDRFIAVSNFQRQKLVDLGLPADRLRTLYNFTERSREPPQGTGDYFLFVGRLQPGKGLQTLFEAFARMPSDAPPLKVAGSCENSRYWRSVAQEAGIADRVEWLGHVSPDLLADLYRGCVALINPSQLNETFGLTCLEAMAHGRPVIAANSGALPEVVRHSRDGMIFEPGDVDQLADAMMYLWRQPSQARDMGVSGWQRVGDTFSSAAHYGALLAIYEEVKR